MSTAKPANIARPSGRQPKDLRPVTISRAFTKHAEGSVLIAFGDTKVLCTASILEKVRPIKKAQAKAGSLPNTACYPAQHIPAVIVKQLAASNLDVPRRFNVSLVGLCVASLI